MRRWTVCVLALLATGGVQVATAGENGCALLWPVRSIARDFARRNCWPEPFIEPDRQAVREPFGLMVANGWERQNLLGDQYFVSGTPQLTEAARLKIQWIMMEAPQQHRVIYVHRALNPQDTQARIDSVRTFAMQLGTGDVPPIQETSISSQGWPAERVDIISRKFNSSMPAPKLPRSGSADGGGGGGGGSGSGGN